MGKVTNNFPKKTYFCLINLYMKIYNMQNLIQNQTIAMFADLMEK